MANKPNSPKYEEFRQFISRFIEGPNSDALINTLADEGQRAEELSIRINDQLFISTASGLYLDRRLADKGITRPPDLGMDDALFRRMGIEINSAKQITQIIDSILSTFYGTEASRAVMDSSVAGPYKTTDGMDLILEFEKSIPITVTFHDSDFIDPLNATAGEVSDVITRSVRTQGTLAYSQVVTDPDSGEDYVRLFGGAKGAYSMIKVVGGEMQSVLEFPTIRGTELQINDTIWQVTKTIGNTIRYRWIGGSQPALFKVIVGDKALIYGNIFKEYGLQGTFAITDIRPAQAVPTYNSGWLEVSNPSVLGLRNSAPDQAPPISDPSSNVYYSWELAQSTYDDLKYFKVTKATSFFSERFAVAFEPRGNLLKIYMPATTKIIERGIIGAAHLHNLYKSDDFDGSFGSTSDDKLKIEVLNKYSIRYKQLKYDNFGSGGQLVIGGVSHEINNVNREGFHTTVETVEPHGIIGAADQWGRLLSDEIVVVTVDRVLTDDLVTPFSGPYMVDPSANYNLTSVRVKSKEVIRAGELKKTLFAEGIMPNLTGQILFDLGKDNQEGPVRFFGSQLTDTPTSVGIVSIAQNGTVVTVTTDKPHGAIPDSRVSIGGTSNFDGVHTINSVASSTIYKFTKTPAATLLETSGISVLVIENVSSTLIMDAGYTFKRSHGVDADITLLAGGNAYVPSTVGADFAPYVTGTAEARVFAKDLIEQITALGINLEIVIVYPSDVGLGNQGGSSDINKPPASDKIFVWGADEV